MQWVTDLGNVWGGRGGTIFWVPNSEHKPNCLVLQARAAPPVFGLIENLLTHVLFCLEPAAKCLFYLQPEVAKGGIQHDSCHLQEDMHPSLNLNILLLQHQSHAILAKQPMLYNNYRYNQSQQTRYQDM
eukprot:6418595-Amphidinium_carterae.1